MTSRWRFISAHRSTYGVQRLCRVLAVSRLGFYAFCAGEPARIARMQAEAELVEQIRQVHTTSGKAYGSPRVAAELRAAGQPVNRKRVARLMRVHGIVGIHLRRCRRTTVRDGRPVATDLLGRDFTAIAPDRRWVGDITYLPVGSSWLYLATVIDLYSRRLVGWSIADHMRAELVCDALEAAVAVRGGHVDGVIFHSDHGAQYVSAVFGKACAGYGVVQSMGRTGTSLDNAAAEAFFATRKRELVHGMRWKDASQVRLAVFAWIGFYNHRRRHSALGYLSPVEFERRSSAESLPTAA